MAESTSQSVDAALQQADLYRRAGRLSESAELYRGILRQRPNDTVVLNNFALLLQEQGELDEAIAVLRRAVELQPDLALAFQNLGIVLRESGRVEEGFAALRKHAELNFKNVSEHIYANEPLPPHKARHDREQRDYLNSIGIQETLHIGNASRVSGRAVNPDTSQGAASAQWQNGNPRIVVIDNILAPEALTKLRQFCLESTIWHQIYDPGYLGAMPEYGFGSPLLAQIAEELPDTYSGIFGQYALRHFWGFKYDSQLRGIPVHADFAAINVNMWITPDEANLDPKSGGLIIWDTPAPLDWDFSKYNGDVEAAHKYLKQTKARATTIPYKCNRVVIFDSDLFHETDRISFKEGYLNRRINITLLYGQREE